MTTMPMKTMPKKHMEDAKRAMPRPVKKQEKKPVKK
jgi:hypothetical protein